MKYTYRKSSGEDIWTVGHDDNGKWSTESDWESEINASLRAVFLTDGGFPHWGFPAELLNDLRKRIEEMHESYRIEGELSVNNFNYRRGAADACGLILDLPELRLFLPAKGGIGMSEQVNLVVLNDIERARVALAPIGATVNMIVHPEDQAGDGTDWKVMSVGKDYQVVDGPLVQVIKIGAKLSDGGSVVWDCDVEIVSDVDELNSDAREMRDAEEMDAREHDAFLAECLGINEPKD